MIEREGAQPEGNFRPQTRPDNGTFKGFHHLKYFTTNALQSASFFTSRMGFEYFAFSNLETGNRQFSAHVVKKGDMIISFESPVKQQSCPISKFLALHGDNIGDTVLDVEDVEKIYFNAVRRGAQSIKPPTTVEDQYGSITMASIAIHSDLVHTLVDRRNYRGLFMPGFEPHYLTEPMNKFFPETQMVRLDHVGIPVNAEDMKPVTEKYFKMLDFHHYWSVDERIMASEKSSLRTTVVSDFDEKVKMPIFEPAPGKKLSQTQEFLDFNNGPGIQHVAILSKDIIKTIETLRLRGVQFLSAPSSYYRMLEQKFQQYNFRIAEDISQLEKNHILVDFYEDGYLLQIFTKPLQDRPTLFFEFIERKNYDGFGVGNFKRLFLAIEEEQRKRGNLTEVKDE